MSSELEIYINGKAHKCKNNQETVAKLLAEAGTSIDESVLVSEDGVKHEDSQKVLEIVHGSKFSTEKRTDVTQSISFTVNGEKCTSTVITLSVEAIFRNAGKGAGVDENDLENYFLENTADGHKYLKLDEQVTISDGDNFVAIHCGSTPVA
ncbi:MAG: hypothetical protein OXG88_07510 [Gammaproteobacteria bacterium]|nr:hypothetical protein [Gammaproteobacteria bacterium]